MQAPVRAGQRGSAAIKAEIEQKIGFFPPFFELVLTEPDILEDLWRQTLAAYLENPLPADLKEELFAYLARYCAVPYCMVCHSCLLGLLGMRPADVLRLLQEPGPDREGIVNELSALRRLPAPMGDWPRPGSPERRALFRAAVWLFLDRTSAYDAGKVLREALEPGRYEHLIHFLAYVRTCFTWVEAHPELSFKADPRVMTHLGVLLEGEPRLAAFFESYVEHVGPEAAGREERLAAALERESRERARAEAAVAQLSAERTASAMERSRAHEALREMEERVRLAIEVTGLGTWDYNVLAGDLRWDERCKELVGLPPNAEVSFETFFTVVHPEDRVRVHEVVRSAMDPSGSGELRAEYRTAGRGHGQGERWLESRGQAFFDEEDRVVRVIGTVLDITEQKRAEEKLKAAVRLRDEFLSIASHELRTPLTTLQLQVDSLLRLLRDERSELVRGRIVGKVETACRQTHRLGALVQSLLEVSRNGTGRLQLEIEDLDLEEVVRDVVERFADEAARHGCRIVLQAASARGRWDRGRVEQVLVNLLANAIKYAPRSDVEIAVSVGPGSATIEVRDQGIGIAPEDLERIFGRFERAVPSRNYGGLGLGLYISRQLAEAHGGSIEVQSRPGEGATFTVRLPTDA